MLPVSYPVARQVESCPVSCTHCAADRYTLCVKEDSAMDTWQMQFGGSLSPFWGFFIEILSSPLQCFIN